MSWKLMHTRILCASPGMRPMLISTMHVLNLMSPDVRPMLINIIHVLISITYKKQEKTIWHMNT